MTDKQPIRIDDELLEDWIDGFLESDIAQEVAAAVEGAPDLLERVQCLKREREMFVSALVWTAETRPKTAAPIALLPSPPVWRQRPAFIVFGLAASLALIALPAWFLGGFQQPPLENGAKGAVTQAFPLDRPTIVLESIQATAGETVYVTLRAHRLDGFCGLQARVTVGPGLQAESTQSSGFTFAGARGDRVTIASISEDGWSSEEGVILRLPIKVEESMESDQELTLEIDSLRLIDADRRS
ncbi:MAG: hypothetical protein KC931_26080, partial [Candidatus Omnitrophica bacterium]|nr:hypothetical protein [Candidatus Omnitrophota bacterium]